MTSRARRRTAGSAEPGAILRWMDRQIPPMPAPTASAASRTRWQAAASHSRRASRWGDSSMEMSRKENPASGTWARKVLQSSAVTRLPPTRAFS